MKFDFQLLLGLSVLLLVLNPTFGGSVALKWDPIPSEDIVGYYLYRSNKPGEGYVRLFTDPTTATSYRDETSQSDISCYVVTAISGDGIESSYSNEVCYLDESSHIYTGPTSHISSRYFTETFVILSLVNQGEDIADYQIQFISAGDIVQTFRESLAGRAQKIALTGDFDFNDTAAESLHVRTQSSSILGFFMLGDLQNQKMDGLGGEVHVSKTLFLPLVGVEEALSSEVVVFISSYASEQSSLVRVSLIDEEGVEVRETYRDLEGGTTVRLNLNAAFGVGGFEETLLKIDSSEEVSAFALIGTHQSFWTVVAKRPKAAESYYASHFFVDGLGGTTRLHISCLPGESFKGRVELLDDFGAVLRAVKVTLHSGETQKFDLKEFVPTTPISGSIRIRGEGRILPLVNYITRANTAQSVLPMESEGKLLADYLYLAQSDQAGVFTGLAIFNPSNHRAAVKVKAFDQEGEAITDSVELILEPGERIADVLAGPSFFGSSFSQINGHFQILSSNPVISFAMFGDSGSKFLSVIQGH